MMDAAKIIANSYGYPSPDKLSTFFLDRKRHYPAMDELNKNGISKCRHFSRETFTIPVPFLPFKRLFIGPRNGMMDQQQWRVVFHLIDFV
ncbi:MAG: hypothetical protein GY868_15325 [Deltaproteobacteria bacterium]|nr:hypothetical protein [Deltaproteobacteria bacterium]